MKNLLIAILLSGILALSSCTSGDRYNTDNLASDIATRLSENLAELNDSSFSNMVITTTDSSDTTCVNMAQSDITSDDKGNIHINLQIDTDGDNNSHDDSCVDTIALISIVLFFFMPVIVVIVVCYFIYRTKRDRNRLVMESISTGKCLPEQFFGTRQSTPTLQPAINYLAWGIGLFLFFMIKGNTSVAMLMFIPIVIGLGKLATYFLARRKKNGEDSDTTSQDSTF